MDDNGQHQDDDFERRLYQVLALLERAGQQQRAAAETLTQAAELEQRVNQAIQAAGAQAAAHIADETRSAIDAAVSSSAQTMRQAARTAVAAAENLRFPWWLNLVVILLAGLLSGSFAFWATHRADLADYQQDQRSQQLIREGQMLERIWPKITPVQRKKLEQLDTQQ
jgi:predicted DCC family thiol-disulfide oxidoreductase YuxK